jgi:hypothetical protein
MRTAPQKKVSIRGVQTHLNWQSIGAWHEPKFPKHDREQGLVNPVGARCGTDNEAQPQPRGHKHRRQPQPAEVFVHEHPSQATSFRSRPLHEHVPHLLFALGTARSGATKHKLEAVPLWVFVILQSDRDRV